MFTAVVAELQILGVHLAYALRLANEIDYAQINPTDTAKKLATQAWKEEHAAIINKGQYIL